MQLLINEPTWTAFELLLLYKKACFLHLPPKRVHIPSLLICKEFTGVKLATAALPFVPWMLSKHTENYNRNTLRITEEKLIKNLNISTRKF